MSFDAIFIDADNTLFDFDRTQRKAIADSLARFSLPAHGEAIAHYNRINRDCWNQHNEGLIHNSEINHLRWSRWTEHMGLIEQVCPVQLADHYEASLAQQCEKETGADELMEYLLGKYPVHIITNGFPAVQAHRWRLAGWEERLQGITVSSVVGVKKPEPEIYHIAMRHVGVNDASRCLMIGDDIKSDVQGPQQVGMKGCWYQRNDAVNETDIEPDFSVRHLVDVLSIA